MADETFKSKGAIEPDSSFSSSNNDTFNWKGAIEPTGAAPAVGTNHIIIVPTGPPI
jgi:hypothetical protein